MSTLFRRLQAAAAAAVIAGASTALLVPTPAAAWGWHHPDRGWHHVWHRGWGWHPAYGRVRPGPVLRVAPPVVAGPVWIRPHRNGPYWVPGHWS